MSAPGTDPLLAQIAELRGRSASRADQLELVRLGLLCRRLEEQPSPVQALLRGRIETRLAELAQRLDQAPAMAPQRPPAAPRTACEPLARLARELRPAKELASVARFRRTWSSGRAQERVLQAASQKPSNAGPLNSHALVSQALELMHSLPEDYLCRFVGQVESLVWLQAARQHVPQPASKGKRRRG